MAIKSYAHPSVLVLLSGPGAITPPVAAPGAGDQPCDEKDLGYPPVVGFHVESSSPCPPIFTLKVDESLQT